MGSMALTSYFAESGQGQMQGLPCKIPDWLFRCFKMLLQLPLPHVQHTLCGYPTEAIVWLPLCGYHHRAISECQRCLQGQVV